MRLEEEEEEERKESLLLLRPQGRDAFTQKMDERETKSTGNASYYKSKA